MKTEKEARKRGERILKIMGPKWKLRVWENMGWCFSVYCTYAALYPTTHDAKTVHCMIGENGTGSYSLGGHGWWESDDPRLAVAHALQAAKQEVKGYQDMLTEVDAALKSSLAQTPSGPKKGKKPTKPKVGRKG